MRGRSHPKVASMMADAREDLLAFCSFPVAHWKKIWWTNPLERLNRGQAPHRRRRRLPRPRRPAAPGRSRPGRGPRRVGRHRPPPPVRRLHDPPRAMTTPTNQEVDTPSYSRHDQPTDPHGVEKLHHSAGRHCGPASRRPRPTWTNHHRRLPPTVQHSHWEVDAAARPVPAAEAHLPTTVVHCTAVQLVVGGGDVSPGGRHPSSGCPASTWQARGGRRRLRPDVAAHEVDRGGAGAAAGGAPLIGRLRVEDRHRAEGRQEPRPSRVRPVE